MCYDSQDCRDNFCCRLVILGPITLLFGLVGMLCFTAGYINNSNFNSGLSKTTCTVRATSVVADTCYYTCNCDNDGKNCQSCPYTCYDGYVTASISGITLGSSFEVIHGFKFSNDVTNYLNTNYPNGTLFTCYYNTNANITGQAQIYLNPKDSQSSYIAGLVFCGLAATSLLIWIIIELFAFAPVLFGEIGEGISNCCYSCRRKIDQRQAAIDDKQRYALEQDLERKRHELEKTDVTNVTPEDFIPPSYSNMPEQYYQPPVNYSEKPSAPPLTESGKMNI